MKIDVQGTVADGFEKVRDAFAANWDDVEVGASVCIVRDGETVVDLWGGYQDRDGTRPWERDTLVNVYSTTKGLATLAVARLHEDGGIDYAAPVAEYWPEFAQAGKGAVTVAQLLSHQAGVCGVETRLTVEDLYDWEKMTSLLAAQRPLWPLGEGGGYHAVTWGYLPGELVRRITGKSLGAYTRETITGPLGADFWIGLPESEHGRVSDLIGPNHARPTTASQMPGTGEPAGEPSRLFQLALQNPSIRPFKDACSAAWRSAEISAANGQANARGIATVYGACVGPDPIVGPASLAAACQIEIEDQLDLVLQTDTRRSRGFIMNSGGAYGPNLASFGHGGAGGSLGFADPDARVGFGYAMNQMQPGVPRVTRSGRLVAALYACLGG